MTLDPARGFGEGVAGCSSDPFSTTCVALRCRAGGPATLALISTVGDFGRERRMPVFLRVDGGTVHRLDMETLTRTGTMEAAIPFDPVAHAALLADLRRGQGWRWRCGRMTRAARTR